MASQVDGLPPHRVLDLGCGRGRHVAALAARGWEAWGIEAVPSAVEEARSALAGIDGAHVLEGDVRQLEHSGIRPPFRLVLDIGCLFADPALERAAFTVLDRWCPPGATMVRYGIFPRHPAMPEGWTPRWVSEPRSRLIPAAKESRWMVLERTGGEHLTPDDRAYAPVESSDGGVNRSVRPVVSPASAR